MSLIHILVQMHKLMIDNIVKITCRELEIEIDREREREREREESERKIN